MRQTAKAMVFFIVAGCASGQMAGVTSQPTQDTSEYFEASFDNVVDATYEALSSLGMYIEARYRSGLDQVISVESTNPTAPANLLITIAQPEVRGVRVSITSADRSGADPVGMMHEAQNILSSIALRVGR